LTPELATALRPSAQAGSSDGSTTIEAPTIKATGSVPPPTVETTGELTHAAIRTTAGSADQLFRLMPGLQNLADRCKRIVVRMEVEADADGSFDRAWFRNAVEEHFDEAGVERDVDLT